MIEVKHLTKKYNTVLAADHVDLVANNGEITILLGPNGAGKSTTIKSIANLLKFQGKIYIEGYPNDSTEAKVSFGYIPDTPVLYDLLTIDEHVKFIASAYKIENYEEIANHYITLFDLETKRKAIAKELSKGMRQKVSMLLALLIQPKALLVDEPMVGLDPASIEETLELFQHLKQEGCAILISTHIIDVIDPIWDEAYIMDHGKIVKHVSRSTLKDTTLKQLFFDNTSEEVKHDEITY